MEKKRILVVDDETGFTRLLKITLEHAGQYEVKEVNDGTEAHAAARQFKPHLVLLDIVMPRIDGGDVAAKISADPSLRGTRIVFLTAIVSQREMKVNDDIGGFPFLAKPVSMDALIKCIEENLPQGTDEAP